MKKIAIVTIESYNYGNRLQNYALQYVLQSLGFETKTMHRRQINKCTKECIKRLVQNILQTKGAKFRQFDKLIDFSNIVIGRDECPAGISEKFDFFVEGSDQVWNPYYDFVAGKCDFLFFAHDVQKIAYAASFGVSEIPLERKEEYATYISHFNYISVRESQAAQIIEELTGRKTDVVLDPTLLLDRKKWENVERKTSKMPKGKYVLVYFLDKKNERFLKKINSLAEKYTVFDIRSIRKGGMELAIGPSEFLYVIKNAEMVLTDSFHATVFSLIYHKKFITYTRDGININSRIESLSNIFGINDCFNEYGDLVCETHINFEYIDKILNEQRRKSLDFLLKALCKS